MNYIELGAAELRAFAGSTAAAIAPPNRNAHLDVGRAEIAHLAAIGSGAAAETLRARKSAGRPATPVSKRAGSPIPTGDPRTVPGANASGPIFTATAKLTVITRDNLFRPGSIAAKRFFAINDGDTVALANANGVDNGYLAHYVRNGLIAIA